MKSKFVSQAVLWLIALFLGLIILHPVLGPEARVSANSLSFDHVYIIAPVFLYKGHQGILLMDRRNANIWFLAKGNDALTLKYSDPVFVTQLPLEKLDHAPR